MPTVAIVDGVKVQFYPDDHPPPHFHVVIGEYNAQVSIASHQLIKGRFPRSKLDAVISWATPRRNELLDAWTAMRSGVKPGRIR